MNAPQEVQKYRVDNNTFPNVGYELDYFIKNIELQALHLPIWTVRFRIPIHNYEITKKSIFDLRDETGADSQSITLP
jgi:hypothetical protein